MKRMKSLVFFLSWGFVLSVPCEVKFIEDEKSASEFPISSVPFLNQSMRTVKYHYTVDKDEGRYLLLLNTWVSLVNSIIAPRIATAFSTIPLNTFQTHNIVYKQYQAGIKALKAPSLFANPAMECNFTDDVSDNQWKTDEGFVQRRLAGMCPFFLQKVTESGKVGMKASDLMVLLNKQILNNEFKMEVAVGEKITLVQAIRQERLFVIYHKELDNFPSFPDQTDTDGNDDRIMRNLSSTVSLFVLKKNGIFSPVAIQWDSKPSARVYQPSDSTLEWRIAKGQADMNNFIACQAGVHLGGIHFTYTVFCIVYKRHFSPQHPLYDLFKYHCDGTTPHISLSYSYLTAPGSSDKFYSIGHTGFAAMASIFFNKRYYGNFDYNTLIKDRGLDDKRITYFPFRQDAQLIRKELSQFVNKVVNRYYGYNGENKDYLVQRDSELQSYANEISSDGDTKPDGGRWKFPGFPKKFATKTELKVLTPEFVPMQAGKLYTRKSGEIQSLEELYPGYHSNVDVLGSLTDRFKLSSFRINRIMDYSEKVQDKPFDAIVRKS